MKEKLRRVVVAALLLFCLLTDLSGCYDAEQGTSNRDEAMRSDSAAWVIQGDRTRRFLREQNRYWSSWQFGSKAGWPANKAQTFPRWPPWTPMGFPPSHAPAPVAPKHMMQPRPARTPSQSIALPPLPAAVAGARHTGVTRPVYIIAAVSVALLVWCGYRSSKVVTVRPRATGLSGQLQKAFVTGVPSLKRSELQLTCEDFSNVIGALSYYMVYKGTLSSGVEIAVVSTTKTSAKEWSKHRETQFRKKITSLSSVNHKNFVNLLGYCQEEHAL